MLLRGLAEAPDLRLRVLVGEDALDRPVDGVFTTDLLNPRRYLTGGEIVLTGLMWRRAPADSESFVAALAAAGAVALAAGDAALGSVPHDLVVACQRHGLPLFEVPVDVSFAAITEQVLASRLRPAGPGPAVARLRALAAGRGRAEPGRGEGAAAGLAEVFAVASREYGAAGWVLSAAGRLVAGAPAAPGGAAGAPGRRARAALAAAWLRAAALPVTVTAEGVPYSLFGVTGEPAPAWPAGSWPWSAIRPAGTSAGARSPRNWPRRPPRAVPATRRPGAARGARPTLRSGACWHGLPVPPARRTWKPPPRCGAAAWTRAGRSSPSLDGQAQPGAGSVPGAAAVTAGAAWPQVARVLLEEMLPGSVAGVHGGAAVALAPGGPAVLDRIRDVTRELAGVYGPGAPGDVASPSAAVPVRPRCAWRSG